MVKQAATSSIIDTLQEASNAGIVQMGIGMGTMAYNLVSPHHNVNQIKLCGQSYEGMDIQFNPVQTSHSFMAALSHRNAGAGME